MGKFLRWARLDDVVAKKRRRQSKSSIPITCSRDDRPARFGQNHTSRRGRIRLCFHGKCLPARMAAVTLVIEINDVTQILHAIAKGDPQAANHLLPIVYEELRKAQPHRNSPVKRRVRRSRLRCKL